MKTISFRILFVFMCLALLVAFGTETPTKSPNAKSDLYFNEVTDVMAFLDEEIAQKVLNLLGKPQQFDPVVDCFVYSEDQMYFCRDHIYSINSLCRTGLDKINLALEHLKEKKESKYVIQENLDTLELEIRNAVNYSELIKYEYEWIKDQDKAGVNAQLMGKYLGRFLWQLQNLQENRTLWFLTREQAKKLKEAAQNRDTVNAG